MQACLDVVLPYVHERQQFGQAIGEFQLIQARRPRVRLRVATDARLLISDVGGKIMHVTFMSVRAQGKLADMYATTQVQLLISLWF